MKKQNYIAGQYNTKKLLLDDIQRVLNLYITKIGIVEETIKDFEELREYDKNSINELLELKNKINKMILEA